MSAANQNDLQLRKNGILIADWEQAGDSHIPEELRRKGLDVVVLHSAQNYHQIPDGQLFEIIVLDRNELLPAKLDDLLETERAMAYDAISGLLPTIEAHRTGGLKRLVSGIDLSYLLELDDDPEFILEMLEGFRLETKEGVCNLQTAMVFRDWGRIRDLSHKLRNPFASIGRRDVYEHLGQMESNAKQEQSLSLLSHQYPLFVRATLDSLSSVDKEINQIRNGYL